jgi:nucleotide-binding universal stress UspA family protein
MTGQNTPPRPGFTQAMTEERTSAFPVVVGINHSGLSALALRRAADEAAHRSAHLHIVVGGDAQEAIDSSATDDREMHTIASILRNRHVTVFPVDSATPGTLLDYCKEVGASLLVVGCQPDTGPNELENPTTAHRLVDEAECDVLVVHSDEQHRDH